MCKILCRAHQLFNYQPTSYIYKHHKWTSYISNTQKILIVSLAYISNLLHRSFSDTKTRVPPQTWRRSRSWRRTNRWSYSARALVACLTPLSHWYVALEQIMRFMNSMNCPTGRSWRGPWWRKQGEGRTFRWCSSTKKWSEVPMRWWAFMSKDNWFHCSRRLKLSGYSIFIWH